MPVRSLGREINRQTLIIRHLRAHAALPRATPEGIPEPPGRALTCSVRAGTTSGIYHHLSGRVCPSKGHVANRAFSSPTANTGPLWRTNMTGCRYAGAVGVETQFVHSHRGRILDIRNLNQQVTAGGGAPQYLHPSMLVEHSHSTPDSSPTDRSIFMAESLRAVRFKSGPARPGLVNARSPGWRWQQL